MKSFLRHSLAAAGCVTALAGCAGTPPLDNVMLSPPQTERIAARPSDWEVRRVQMPEYLDSYDIELRTSDYVVKRLHSAKWAERLPVAMTRLLQQTIDEKLVDKRDLPYQVDVGVDTFEPQPSGQVVLSARWKVTDTRDRHVVARDDALIQEPLPGAQRHADAVGRAMSTAVRELGLQIVAAAG